jgi:hypothetical protein
MDTYRVRQLLIVAAAIAVGASLWFLPRAASFIRPSPPTPIELQAAPTPTGDRGTSGGAPAERVETPASGDDADDGGNRASGAGNGASAGDSDDDDDRGAGSGSSTAGDDDDDTGDGDDDGDDGDDGDGDDD